MKKTFLSLTIAGLAMAAFPVFASASVIYNALPDQLPPNAPSQPFQAQQTFEFGDYIHLGGSIRNLTTVTVAMSTWAPYSEHSSDSRYTSASWTHPITINIYSNHLNANGVLDQLLASKTQDITIPWRPAGDPSCPDSGYGAGFAWKAADGQCYNGFAFNAVFDLSGLNVVLPDDVIITLAYNTQSYGAQPIGVDGPYNSLNVLVPSSQPVTVGSDDSNNEVFWNTVTAAWYSDKGAAGSGVLRKDTNWAPYGTVAMKVEAKTVEPLTAPANGMPNGICLSTNDFDFNWDAPTGGISPITYEFQSSLNPAQTAGILTTSLWKSGILPSNTIHSSGAPDGVWYWQVRAKDSLNNASDWSPIWTVTLDHALPGAPALISPANDSIIASHDFGFDWWDSADQNGVAYEWQSSLDPAFASVLVDHTGLASSFINSPGTPDGVYYWRVRAVDCAGNSSAWSEIWKVTVNTTPVVPPAVHPITKDQCKNGGWEKLVGKDGKTFKNQGQCVSFVEANEKAGKR